MHILLDADEVLVELLEGMNSFYNERHGTSFKKDDYKSYHWWETWNCSFEYAVQVCDDFMNSQSAVSMNPVDGSVQGVRLLKERNHVLSIATSRSIMYETATKEWLRRTYGEGAFRGIHLLSHYDGNASPVLKSTIALNEGIHLAVDDQTRHALDYASASIPCLLFHQPWNKDDKLPSQTIRVYSWNDILREVEMMEELK